MIKYNGLFEKFFRYVKIDTQSKEKSPTTPSTIKQKRLARILSQELKDLGLDVEFDEKNCIVYGFLKGNKLGQAVGFMSHIDTSPEVSGFGVNPRMIENYDGSDELLKTEDFPELEDMIGKDLIATDGNTLLGADDKAGIAEIMYMLQYFYDNKNLMHKSIAVAFTPDEEIGAGTDNFDISKFKAKSGYTVDGGKYGIVEYECFNAAKCSVTINGKNVHTGSAKNVMLNAAEKACEFSRAMPENEKPEYTENHEGFFHLEQISGGVEKCRLEYLIRDFDKDNFEKRKETMKNIAEYFNKKYGSGTCEIEIIDQYKNMAEVIKKHYYLIENAYAGIKAGGYVPKSLPIRGGTDGASLSFQGLPMANLPTGGYNYHSRYEYACVQEMEACADLLIYLATH